MRTATSLALVAIGAILTFAVTATPAYLNLQIVGVIVMLDPLGLSFQTMSLVVLGATFCYSMSTVLVRVNSRHDSDAATLFWFSVVSSVVSVGAAIPDWIWPTAIDICSMPRDCSWLPVSTSSTSVFTRVELEVIS